MNRAARRLAERKAEHRPGVGPVGFIADLQSPYTPMSSIAAAIHECGLSRGNLFEVIERALAENIRWVIVIADPQQFHLFIANTRRAAIRFTLEGFEWYRRFSGNWSCQRRLIYLCDDSLIGDINSLLTPDGPIFEIKSAADSRKARMIRVVPRFRSTPNLAEKLALIVDDQHPDIDLWTPLTPAPLPAPPNNPMP
jgi:hypothetical protein